MSSTNKTEHLQLNQWVGTDPFRMADFNEDNRKIDEAVQANTQAIAAKANIAFGSYKGTGAYGKNTPNTLTFGFEPKLLIIRTPTPTGNQGVVQGMTLVRGTQYQYSDTIGFNSSFCYVVWGEKSVSWYVTSGNEGDQCNQSDVDYYYIAIG